MIWNYIIVLLLLCNLSCVNAHDGHCDIICHTILISGVIFAAISIIIILIKIYKIIRKEQINYYTHNTASTDTHSTHNDSDDNLEYTITTTPVPVTQQIESFV